MKNLKKSALCLLVSLISFRAFCDINIISPISGTWSNKQMLVIDNSDGSEYFYSIDGSDPSLFGFAYDGPVLLDVSGHIELKVSHKNERTQVNYTVALDDARENTYNSFIQNFFDLGVYNYTSGSILSIPQELSYSLENFATSFITGQDIALSEKNVISKYIPCTLLDENTHKMWRFIIHTFPQYAGSYSRKDVPFEIKDWNTIVFTDQNLLYKIDSDYWELPKEPKTIDRTVSHMISWQSLEYEQGNPVEFFVLPTKPEVKTQITDTGATVFYIENNAAYTMCPMANNNSYYQELFSQVGIDVFYGEKVSGSMELGLYANAVYQGTVTVDYNINKRPPAMPKIISDSKGFYSRQKVNISFLNESDSELFVSVSDPFVLQDLTINYDESSSIFNQVKLNEYKKVNASNYKLALQGIGEGAVYYKICAYSCSENINSRVSEYGVIIDQYNFYFDSTQNSLNGDGTIEHPYNNFKDCLEEINKSRSVCLRIKGNFNIPKGQNLLLTNCQLINNGDAVINFDSGACLVVRNSSLEMENMRMQTKSNLQQTSIIPFIKLENSVCTLTNVQINGDFSKNGSAIDAFNSVINFSKVLAAINSTTYASFISSNNSRINISDSSINVSSETAVIFSVNKGSVNIKNNSLKITGKTGRIAEFFTANAVLENNKYKYQLIKDNANFVPIFINKATVLKENNNELIKF